MMWLRPYAADDFDDYYAYMMDDELRLMLGMTQVTDRPSAEVAFQWLRENRAFLALVSKETGRAIGHICIHPADEELRNDPVFSQKTGCSLSYAIAKAERRKGLMEEALRALIRELFGSRLVDYIDCCYSFENTASGALQEKLGFSFWKQEPWDGLILVYTIMENERG